MPIAESITIRVVGYTLEELEKLLGPIGHGKTITAVSYEDDMWEYTKAKAKEEARMKNCKEIIEEYLIANGFDGLFNSNGDCACKLDNLFPCADCFDECEPGYIHDPQNDHEEFRICREKKIEKRTIYSQKVKLGGAFGKAAKGFRDTLCPVDSHPCEGQGTDADCRACLTKTRREDRLAIRASTSGEKE